MFIRKLHQTKKFLFIVLSHTAKFSASWGMRCFKNGLLNVRQLTNIFTTTSGVPCPQPNVLMNDVGYRQINHFIKPLKAVSVSILFCLTVSHTVQAQEAFSEIRLTATAQKHLGNTDFTRHWTPNAGFGFELSTPYHAGSLEAGVRVFRFDAFSYENSGFYSHYVFAGWHYRYAASDNLFLVPGIRLGNNFMLHDEDKIYMDEYKFSREESEFFYEILLRLEMDVSKNVGFYISTAYNRTLFNIPFPAFYGTAGLTLKFQSPRWLKQSLQ